MSSHTVKQRYRQVKEYYTGRGADRIFDYDQYTCSEHFSPYYGYLIADKIAELMKKYGLLHILEVGGGRGQLAFDILSRMREEYPDCYRDLIYTIVDISYELQLCQRKILNGFPVRLVTASATGLPFGFHSLRDTIVLSNEVLADLPSIIPGTEDCLEAGVRRLIEKAGVMLEPDTYCNEGAFQFLLEANRVLCSGVIILIEYGVDSNPKARILGTQDQSHVEVAINMKELEAVAKQLFSDVSVGTIVEFAGKEALNTMVQNITAVPPGEIVEWLSEFILRGERINPKRLSHKLIESIFAGKTPESEACIQKIKFWHEQIESAETLNRYERAFLENLTALFMAFDEMYGTQAACELLYSLRRLHRFSSTMSLQQTFCPELRYVKSGCLQENFFYLFCRSKKCCDVRGE